MRYVYSGHQGFLEAVAGRLEEAGFTRVADVSQADVALTFCESQTALEDVYFGDDGFVQNARKGTLFVDLSASTPSFARELVAVAMVSDFAFVEAPLLVEDLLARDAFSNRDNLKCLVGGEDADIERAKPLLMAVAGTMDVVGGSGSAQLARAVYSLQMAAQVVSAVEADALYCAVVRSTSGIDLGFKRAGAVSVQAERVLEAIGAGAFTGPFTIELFMAELSAALMAADDADLILPQAEAAMHLLELLAVIGGVDKAPSALALVYGDEKTCAENGLDWTRAEQAYADEDDDFGYGYDDDDDGCGCGHDHDHGDDEYRGFDYSSN